MRLLFDQNLSFRLPARIVDLFPGSSQARLLGLETATDHQVGQFAREQDFVVVTLDSDFAELASLHGPPPLVVWLRCGNQPTSTVEALLRRHARDIGLLTESSETSCLEIY